MAQPRKDFWTRLASHLLRQGTGSQTTGAGRL